MPRGKAPKSRAARATKNTKKEKAPQCSEECDMFSGQNIDDLLESLNDQDFDPDLDEELDKLPTIPQHSEELYHCCNVAAHQDRRHYVCKFCASLASTYLRKPPNALLHGGPPSISQSQRFFPLCKKCTVAAQASGNQGCICDCLGQALCFQCKRDSLELAAAKCDVELKSRLAFVPCGEKAGDEESEFLFMKPVFKCICGSEDVEGGDGGKGVMRCAGCEGTVVMVYYLLIALVRVKE